MSDSDQTTDDAGSRFPFINLEKALGRAREFYNESKGHDVLVSDAFGIWGYSQKSSGGHQTIAALKMYGILTDEGTKEQRKLRLTGAGLQYFRDEREDVHADLRRQFAVRPKLIRALWEAWGLRPPADNIARSHLKIGRHLSDQAARSLLNIYKENLAFADLTGDTTPQHENKSKSGNETPSEIEVGDLIQAEVNGEWVFNAPKRVRAVQEHEGKQWVFVDGERAGILMEQAKLVEKSREGHAGGQPPIKPPELALANEAVPEGWHEERLIDDSGEEIFVRFKGQPSSKRYEYVRDYYDFKIKRVEPKAGQ